MKQEWLMINITVKGALVEMVGALLAAWGCSGTVIEDRALDSFEVPDQELDPATDYQLTTYFVTEQSAEQLIAELKAMLRSLPALGHEAILIEPGASVVEADWAHDWRQNFTSFHIGNKLLVRPSWEPAPDTHGEAVIEIDPGMAFGTGTHATTRLCLEVITDLISKEGTGLRLLDVGTGSGILAIGAAALGCSQIVATDIDPSACSIARENAAKNSCSDQILITDEPLETLDGTFDLIVANILAEENIRLKDAFMGHLAGDGWLILSGILQEKTELVSRAFAGRELEPVARHQMDEWVCLVFRRLSPD